MTERHAVEADQSRIPGLVLLVIDQPVLARVVQLALNHGTFITRAVPSATEATALLREWRPHLVIADMDIGQGHLNDEWGKASARAKHLPFIALTRRGDLKTTLAAFDWGVDDILTVPFSPEELVARVLAVMRRTYRAAIPLTPTIRAGDLEIDILNRRVRAGTSELHLTPVEQNLLYLLAANAGRVLTRDEIVDALWGVDYLADSNVVDQHIRNLRTKLQDRWHNPRYIATVPGQGYRFLSEASSVEHAR